MDSAKWKHALPTVASFWERRRQTAQNQLPRHLRAPSKWPIRFQLLLNLGILITLITLMLNKDDYVSEAGPAIGLVVCSLLLIYTLIAALQLRQRFDKIDGQKLAKVNVWLMVIAFLSLPLAIATFLP